MTFRQRRFGPVLALLCAALSACALRVPVGTLYPRPVSAPGIVVGRSTEADIVAVYGQPTRRTETGSTHSADPRLAASFQPFIDVTLVYQNGDRVVAAYAAPRQSRLRTITFRLHDGALAGYAFSSPFPEDSHAFDTEAAAALLKRPDVTRADLEAAIGPPLSRQTYPATTPNAASEVDTWGGTIRNPAGTLVETQALTVTFGTDGKVTRHTLNDTNTQL